MSNIKYVCCELAGVRPPDLVPRILGLFGEGLEMLGTSIQVLMTMMMMMMIIITTIKFALCVSPSYEFLLQLAVPLPTKKRGLHHRVSHWHTWRVDGCTVLW